MFKKIIILGIIPFLLFILGVGLFVRDIYRADSGVISRLSSQFTLSHQTYVPLLKGQKITGRFKALFNYLGIVSVRFWTFYRLNNDSVIFRIKKEGSPSWYYSAGYKTDQFQPDALFPFGFPAIPDSRGQTFIFEIESVSGGPTDSVGLSRLSPSFVSVFKYPRERLSNRRDLLSFAGAKFINTLSHPDQACLLYIFFFPFLSFILFLLHRSFNPAVYLATFLDTFFVFTNDLSTLVICLVWLALIYLHRTSPKKTFVSSLAFILMAAVISFTVRVNAMALSQSLAGWGFLLLILTVIQLL